MTPEQFFKTPQQLKRYRYAAQLSARLIALQESGYVLFDSNVEPIKGKIRLITEFHRDPWSLVFVGLKGCKISIIDIEYWDNGNPWICSIANIKKKLGFKYAKLCDFAGTK